MRLTHTDMPEMEAPNTTPPKPRADVARPISRRSLFKKIIGVGAVAAASGAYGHDIEPFWVDWHDVPMPIRGLPRSFDGMRMVQLSDLHAGYDVPLSYLKDVVAKVKQRKPDLVVVTGDLVNHTLSAVVPVSDLLAELPAVGIPIITILGNHDYEVSTYAKGNSGAPARIADALESELTSRKIPLLRNRSMAFERGGEKLWFAGLEDLWSGRFSPEVAFADMPRDVPIIALSHNPDTATELDGFGVQWTLSGHTHGGQVRVPGYGAIILNVQNAEFQQGLFKLAHSHLYVSRGVGYLKRIRIFCRPEVPTFVLQSIT